MSAEGRDRRMARIRHHSSGRVALLPLDLAVPLGPLVGAEDQLPLVEMAGALGVDAVLLRWGEARRLIGALSPEVALIVRLTGSTAAAPDAFDGLLHSVEASLAIGADGVCVDLQLGHRREYEMMRNLSAVCESCDRLGAVCLVEAVPTGDEAGRIPWAARTAQELGADLVKVPYPGSGDAMREVVRQCQVPVIVAGGPPVPIEELFQRIETALEAGACGTAISRNVITSGNPYAVQAAILEIVHDGKPAGAALKGLLDGMQS
jgi:2-amino-4,5-dihydroxy-6-oxo-7-(phosphooxy)heptanoate synthase